MLCDCKIQLKCWHQGLHHIALSEVVCSARVCEVLLYLLSTLLDLGTLKPSLNRKKNNNNTKAMIHLIFIDINLYK